MQKTVLFLRVIDVRREGNFCRHVSCFWIALSNPTPQYNTVLIILHVKNLHHWTKLDRGSKLNPLFTFKIAINDFFCALPSLIRRSKSSFLLIVFRKQINIKFNHCFLFAKYISNTLLLVWFRIRNTYNEWVFF